MYTTTTDHRAALLTASLLCFASSIGIALMSAPVPAADQHDDGLDRRAAIESLAAAYGLDQDDLRAIRDRNH